MSILVVDADDFSEDYSKLDVLFALRAKRPNFKITLFTPPMRSTPEFLRITSELPWIELAIHGWAHNGQECLEWNKSEARHYLVTALGWGVFVNGFKAPHWSMSQPVYDACKELGVWVADNPDRSSSGGLPIPEDQQIYMTAGAEILHGVSENGYTRIHGHISWAPAIDNDITRLYHRILDQSANGEEFAFISEVVERTK